MSDEHRLIVKAALKQAAAHVDAQLTEAESSLRSTFQWEELDRLQKGSDREFERAFLEALEELEAGKPPEEEKEEKGRVPFHEHDEEEEFHRANDARMEKFNRGVE